MADATERKFVKVELEPPAWEAFTGLLSERGLTQIQGATRMVRWFMQQQPIVQQWIWGQLPAELHAEAARLLAINLEQGGGMSPGQVIEDEIDESFGLGKNAKRKRKGA